MAYTEKNDKSKFSASASAVKGGNSTKEPPKAQTKSIYRGHVNNTPGNMKKVVY